MKISKLVAALSAATLFAIVPASTASANTTPNPWSPQGESWISVAESSKVYLESFGESYDDDEIYYVGEGHTCTYNNVVATGPFLTTRTLNSGECVDDGGNATTPIDTATRAGTFDFGFDINFYGTTFSSGWPNTNGGLFFAAPNSRYDKTLAVLAGQGASSAMFPLGGDLYYEFTESNFWAAQTTIDGHDAVVFSWEKFHNCCNDGAAADDMSFQLVLIDAGNGDFNAMFNYDRFENFDEGYRAPAVLIDMANGTTVGSNIVEVQDVTNVGAGCYESSTTNIGTITDSTFSDAAGSSYFKLEDASDKTISVWTDNACTVPLNVSVAQDVANDKNAYLQLNDRASTVNAVGAGWSTYDSLTGVVDATELLFNIDTDTLLSTGTDPLVDKSWNTDVPGRFVMGQRGGSTVVELEDLGGIGTGEAAGPEAEEEAQPELAATGATDVAPLGIAAFALIAVGIAATVRRRNRA